MTTYDPTAYDDAWNSRKRDTLSVAPRTVLKPLKPRHTGLWLLALVALAMGSMAVSLSWVTADRAGAQDNITEQRCANIINAASRYSVGDESKPNLRQYQPQGFAPGTTVTWSIDVGNRPDIDACIDRFGTSFALYGHPTNPHTPADPNSVLLTSGDRVSRYIINVTIPTEVTYCGYQLDAVVGPVITSFSTGERYGPRLVDAANWSQEGECDIAASTTTTRAPTTSVPPPSSSTTVPPTTSTVAPTTSTTAQVTSTTAGPTTSSSTPPTTVDPGPTTTAPGTTTIPPASTTVPATTTSTTLVTVQLPDGSSYEVVTSGINDSKGQSLLARTGSPTGTLINIAALLIFIGILTLGVCSIIERKR